jgi:hypothetical protein
LVLLVLDAVQVGKWRKWARPESSEGITGSPHATKVPDVQKRIDSFFKIWAELYMWWVLELMCGKSPKQPIEKLKGKRRAL